MALFLRSSLKYIRSANLLTTSIRHSRLSCPLWASHQNKMDSGISVTQNRFNASAAESPSWYNQIAHKMGFNGILKYSQRIMQQSAIRMYLSAMQFVDYELFFKEFQLEDTFYTWFRITELHMWLMCVRLAPEGREGTFIRNNMVNSMWEDVAKRIMKMGVYGKSKRDTLFDLDEQFRACLFVYDEGLLSNDADLAAVLWRRFFNMNPDTDAENIAKLVHYVRKQVVHIEEQSSESILKTGLVTLLPLHGEQYDKDHARDTLNKICAALPKG